MQIINAKRSVIIISSGREAVSTSGPQGLPGHSCSFIPPFSVAMVDGHGSNL